MDGGIHPSGKLEINNLGISGGLMEQVIWTNLSGTPMCWLDLLPLLAWILLGITYLFVSRIGRIPRADLD